ncbi:hypothetical protein M0R45_010827 [Rubus argutus]|uniref:Uncharacterized protein n=1 Tax=Rubus argutus TaxID=59490 RepID=A0AAW1Y878_RUBAR
METNPAPSKFITLPVLFFAQQCPAAAHAQSATPQLSLSASTTTIVPPIFPDNATNQEARLDRGADGGAGRGLAAAM